jgi:hypothetical protein
VQLLGLVGLTVNILGNVFGTQWSQVQPVSLLGAGWGICDLHFAGNLSILLSL